MKMKVQNTCFNGHTWEQVQEVDIETGVTDYNRCSKCKEPIQLQSIPEFKN